MKTPLPPDSSPRGIKRKCLALLIWAAAISMGVSACVETAECDETVSCASDEACYEFKCRPLCTYSADCERGQCLPCQEELPGGVVQHCFTATSRVCVVE